VSSRQSVAAVEDWLLGTPVAPAGEAGASIRRRLMTADRSPAFASGFGGQALDPNPFRGVYRVNSRRAL